MVPYWNSNNKMNGKVVCVTGGTGYLGSWMVKRLLEDGYYVNTTIRNVDPGRKRDVSYLTNLPGASERLQIFIASLEEPGSYAAAIKGCIGVFHVAHPLDFEENESEETKTKRTVSAVHSILQACIDSKTVQRVVLTSSISTVALSGSKPPLDETCWTDVDFVRRSDMFLGPYVVTKTLTEQAAFEFAAKQGLDLVSILPTWITGPFITPNVPDTIHVTLALLLGHEKYYPHLKQTSMVHVDDVARAHIHVFETPSAKGRYLCTGTLVTITDLYQFLPARYPDYPLPTILAEKEIKESSLLYTISSQKLLDIGFKFQNGLEEIYDEAIQCCKRKGLL